MPLELQTATLPPDTPFPATFQLLLDAVPLYVAIVGGDTLTGIVISETEPGVDDQDKIWAQTDGSGAVLGFFFYLGEWIAIPLTVPETAGDPVGAVDGQLNRNSDRGSGLEMRRSGTFTSNLFPEGTTAERNAIASPPTNFLFFDTTIKRLLRYTGAAWTTYEGVLGEQRTFNGVSLADALTAYPGWSEDTDMADRVLMGSSGTKAPDSEGGRESFSWKIKRRQINTASEDTVVGVVHIDGVDGNSPDTTNTLFGTATDVPILNPYRSVVVLKKTTH